MSDMKMDRTRQIKISKYLSKHLRHEPDRLGLTLAPGGWVEGAGDRCRSHAPEGFYLLLF